MDDVLGELEGEALIRVGGWNPSYARVLLIEHDAHNAVVVVDGNGDGAELELEYWHRDADGRWRGGSSSGHGPLDRMPALQTWNAGPFVVALGRAEPSADVSVQYGRELYRRRANEHGLWGFVHTVSSAWGPDLPTVTAG